MKGRTNYLCLHRFERLHRGASRRCRPTIRSWMRQIAEWAAGHSDRRSRRDRRHAGRPAALVRADARPASSASAASARVTPTASSRGCASAPRRPSVVIVNHHLLCADASVRQGAFGEVIPECELAVIDEAHQLEDVVTQYFGVSFEHVSASTSCCATCRRRTRTIRSTEESRPGGGLIAGDGRRPGDGSTLVRYGAAGDSPAGVGRSRDDHAGRGGATAGPRPRRARCTGAAGAAAPGTSCRR